MLRILGVTGGRADWGLLAPVLSLIRDDEAFALTLAATGQHLVPMSGHSLAAIEAEGFKVDANINLEIVDDAAVTIARSIGLGVERFGGLLAWTKPELVLVLGDRYEILAVVVAALIARIPVVHLCGGDITEGAIDDAIRHSITKMSHLHFVTHEAAARRVRQMGEDPARIFNVGSPGIDRIRLTKLMERDEFFASIDFRPRARNALVTFHPVTVGHDSERQCRELLAALEALGHDLGLIFTGVNTDVDHGAVARLIREFVHTHENATEIASLGSSRYLSALRHADVVVGNSSSGLYEAPSFRVPTVNVGERQQGRLQADSVVDSPPERTAIRSAIDAAFHLDCSTVINPYGDGHAAERIIATLKTIGEPRSLLRKTFFAIEGVTS